MKPYRPALPALLVALAFLLLALLAAFLLLTNPFAFTTAESPVNTPRSAAPRSPTAVGGSPTPPTVQTPSNSSVSSGGGVPGSLPDKPPVVPNPSLHFAPGYTIQDGWLVYGWSNAPYSGTYHATQNWHFAYQSGNAQNGSDATVIEVSENPDWVPNVAPGDTPPPPAPFASQQSEGQGGAPDAGQFSLPDPTMSPTPTPIPTP